MKIEPYYVIPGRQEGLILDSMPTGDFLGFDDMLLHIVSNLKISGNVEFYATADDNLLCTPGSKMALGISNAVNTAAIKSIKRKLDEATSNLDLGHYPTGPEDDDCDYDDEPAVDNTAPEENIEDLWSIKSLGAIRREFIYVGTIEYNDGSVVAIPYCSPNSPLFDLIKDEFNGRNQVFYRKLFQPLFETPLTEQEFMELPENTFLVRKDQRDGIKLTPEIGRQIQWQQIGGQIRDGVWWVNRNKANFHSWLKIYNVTFELENYDPPKGKPAPFEPSRI